MIDYRVTNPVRIVVDSSTCLDLLTSASFGITIVPLHVIIDGHDYRDLIDITASRFYRLLRSVRRPPTTSAPSVGDYLDTFNKADGSVLCLTVASSLSSMYQSALEAARRSDRNVVHVLDTGTAAAGLRLVATATARLAATGADVEELKAKAGEIASRVRMHGMLETLDFLARSGRVPRIVANTSSFLGVRPIFRFHTGGTTTLARVVRSPAAGLKVLENIMARAALEKDANANGHRLVCCVFHADANKLAERLIAQHAKRFPTSELSVSELTPAIGAHTGPGVVGQAFYVDTRPIGKADGPGFRHPQSLREPTSSHELSEVRLLCANSPTRGVGFEKYITRSPAVD